MILVAGLSSCSSEINRDIFHDFQVHNSHSTSLIEVSKLKDWQTIDSLTFIPVKPPADRTKFSSGWIRISFTVSEAHSFKALHIDVVNITDTVYINGNLVGKINKPGMTPVDYFKPRLYKLPTGLVVNGSNEMYMRIETPGFLKGTIRSMGLLTSGQYESELRWLNFYYKELIYIVLVFFFSLIVLQGTMYMVDRKIWIRLINVFFLLYHMSVYFIFFTTKDLFSGNHQLWVDFSFTYIYLGTTVLILFLTVLFQSLYRIILSQLNRLYIPGVIVGAIALVCTSGDIFIQIIIHATILVFGFIALIYMLYLLNRIKPNPFLIRVIIIELALFSLTILWGTLGGIFELGIRPPDSIPLFLSIIYIFLAFLYEAILAKRQRDRIKRLYNELKKNSESTIVKAEPQITSTSEEKLETVLEFIRQNYTSDLSREGLAAAVDMNTSYFSTLFNTYTGKKINEYIHSLRIKDAIELLNKSDDKIIDIAFSVGFESLATFNRAFKHETGSTPTKYRKNL